MKNRSITNALDIHIRQSISVIRVSRIGTVTQTSNGFRLNTQQRPQFHTFSIDASVDVRLRRHNRTRTQFAHLTSQESEAFLCVFTHLVSVAGRRSSWPTDSPAIGTADFHLQAETCRKCAVWMLTVGQSVRTFIRRIKTNRERTASTAATAAEIERVFEILRRQRAMVNGVELIS